ncbi:MAG: phosphatase PAP2 family protein [Actinomycetota bacterium]
MKNALPDFVRRRLDPAQRYGLRVTLFGIAIALVGIPFGWLVDQVIRRGGFVRVDTSAAIALHDAVRGHTALIGALKWLTFVGGPIFLTAIVVLCSAFLVWRRRYRLLSFLIVTSIGGSLIDSSVKILVDRSRPNLANPIVPLHGKSFPSGHTMSSTIVYGALLLIFFPVIPRRRRLICVLGVLVLVSAIGLSRLALGVHYISDVVGGFVLGLAWLVASTAAFSIWREERGRRPVAPMRGLEPEARHDISHTA